MSIKTKRGIVKLLQEGDPRKIEMKDICCSPGARGVVAIVVGNGHGDTSSNPGRDWLHFT